MLLTQSLIERLHHFQIDSMSRSIDFLRSVEPSTKGQVFGSGFATFAGDGSPLTKVYGIGHDGSNFDLEAIDLYFEGLSKNWELIVTPFSSRDLMQQATARGYVPDHFETLMGQIVEPSAFEIPTGLTIEEVQDDLTEWTLVTDAGWMESEVLPQEPSHIGKVMAAWPARRYLGRIDGEPAATACLCENNGTYLFAGACTRPQFRGRGLQTALTRHRIQTAGAGALILVAALPGSQSHRNLQRIGFQPIYSELVMFRQATE